MQDAAKKELVGAADKVNEIATNTANKVLAANADIEKLNADLDKLKAENQTKLTAAQAEANKKVADAK